MPLEGFRSSTVILSQEMSRLWGVSDAVWGAWFRVVIDPHGSLYTAFRDHFTELQGGRDVCLTPDTTRNFRHPPT